MPSFTESLQEASNALRAGNRVSAWRNLQPALTYPAGLEMCDDEFAEGLEILSNISNGRTSSQAKTALKKARAEPTDIQALFDVGSLLRESRLPQIAATALARGNQIAPDIPALVNELSTALAESGHYREAFEALQAASGAREQDWFTRYLYSFNALMSGHMVEARQGLALLGGYHNDEATVLYDRLARLINRSRSVGPWTPLDATDLRGWHYVITGGLITHLAAGQSNVRNGRYTKVRDSHELMHEGVVRAATVFDSWDKCPKLVVYSNDPSSKIMAHVWHRRIGVPIRPYSPGDPTRDAMFVAYDLQDADRSFVDALERRQPGQILFSHASHWSRDFGCASDISTYLYEHNSKPWGADPGPANTIAGRVVATELTRASLHDLAPLARLARAAGRPEESGPRDRFCSLAAALAE